MFLQSTFYEEHLWRLTSMVSKLHPGEHTVSCFLSLSTVIIHQFHSYSKIFTLIPTIPTLIFRIPTLILGIPTLIPRIPIIPTLIPRISTLIPCILIIPLISFSDSLFRLLQIAFMTIYIYIYIYNILYIYLYFYIMYFILCIFLHIYISTRYQIMKCTWG